MKLLVDAQLPVRLARVLGAAGHDAVHTKELPGGNANPDSDLNVLSLRESRILVSKDADFSTSFVLRGEPFKLLLVSTGNIRNVDLETLFLANLDHLAELFAEYRFLELSRDSLIVHE